MEYIRRSKWAPSACKLEGSRRRRPWLEAWLAALDEELEPCCDCEAATAICCCRNLLSLELRPSSETGMVDMCTYYLKNMAIGMAPGFPVVCNAGRWM